MDWYFGLYFLLEEIRDRLFVWGLLAVTLIFLGHWAYRKLGF